MHIYYELTINKLICYAHKLYYFMNSDILYTIYTYNIERDNTSNIHAI